MTMLGSGVLTFQQVYTIIFNTTTHENLFTKQADRFIITNPKIPPSTAKEWEPGYILTKTNILRGLIAYSRGGSEWQYGTFKAGSDGHEQNFLPADIKNFTYDSGLRYKFIDLQVGKIKGWCFVRSLVEGFATRNEIHSEQYQIGIGYTFRVK